MLPQILILGAAFWISGSLGAILSIVLLCGNAYYMDSHIAIIKWMDDNPIERTKKKKTREKIGNWLTDGF